MDLIKSTDSKYEEYENLLLERDQITKEAGQIWTVYLQLFGKLITDNYEEKLECIKCKKTIAYYQNALNHGGVVDSAAMEKYMEQEMAEYYANLRRMLKENEDANNAGTSTPYEVARAKTLYRRLAKLIHPDINPETDHSKELQELWQRILIAYHHNDVKELSELEVLVRKVLKELGSEDVKVDIPDIEEKIEALRSEIEEIKQTPDILIQSFYGPQVIADISLIFPFGLRSARKIGSEKFLIVFLVRSPIFFPVCLG